MSIDYRQHMDAIHVVTEQLTSAIKSNKMDVSSPFSIVAKGMEIVNQFPSMNGNEKKAMLMKVLRQIAAGKDGIEGTADDLLPAKTLDAIQLMLEKDLISDFANVASDIAKGKVNLQKVIETAKTSVPLFIACLGPLLAGKKAKYMA